MINLSSRRRRGRFSRVLSFEWFSWVSGVAFVHLMNSIQGREVIALSSQSATVLPFARLAVGAPNVSSLSDVVS